MAREKGMGNLQREKSGRWTIRVGLNGKRYCRSTRTADRDKAERILRRFLAPLGLGDNRLPLGEVWNEYVKSPNRNDLSPATLNAKRVVWMNFARWMERNHLEVGDLAGVTPDAIGEYLACLRTEICASSYNNRVCVLREIFHALAAKAGQEDDPWEGVRLLASDSHSRRELTMEELRRLLEAAKVAKTVKAEDEGEAGKPDGEGGGTREWHVLFLIGIYTGLRLGDCCRLDWSSVNLAQGVIQLVPRKTRRHSHGRPVTIPIHPALGSALLEARPLPPSGGPVLPSIYGLYQRASWRISEELSRIFKAAGIVTSVRIEGRKHRTPEATFHSLRHTFVSFAANAGIPLHVIQSIVGHESTAMTRHYYHENIAALQSAVAAIPTLS